MAKPRLRYQKISDTVETANENKKVDIQDSDVKEGSDKLLAGLRYHHKHGLGIYPRGEEKKEW